MRPVIKRRRECSDHRSSTPRTGTHSALSVLSRGRRNPSVLGLPSFAPLDYAVRFHGFRSGAPLGATRRRFRRFVPGCSLCCALRPPLAGYSETSPASGTRRPHLACGRVCTALLLLHTGDTPTCSDTKRGDGFPPPRRVKCQTVNPSVTVFSVDESNALAASVTGK